MSEKSDFMSGISDFGSMKRGSKKCARCQSFGCQPDSCERSGPVRSVPSRFGDWSLPQKSPGSDTFG